MLTRVRDRGPHGERLVALPGGGVFGHTSLPLDTASCQQPWADENGVVISFNGEIFNAREIAQRELGVAAAFPGEAVLLALLVHRYGAKGLSVLRGMYAIAAWDSSRGELLLARDQLGKKPLYYSLSPASSSGAPTVVFGSVLDAVQVGLDEPVPPSNDTLNEYLRGRCIAPPRTALKGVQKVRPGEILTVKDGTVRATLLQRIAPVTHVASAPAPDLGAMLTTAVRRRVEELSQPPGLLFSGGVDSMAVGAVMTRLAPATVDAFSVAVNVDEEAWIRHVAQKMGMRAHIERPSVEDLAEEALMVLANLDEPMADPSLVVTRRAARLASQRTEVVLTGDGADELFYGYRWFEAQRLLYRLRWIPDVITRNSFKSLASPKLSRFRLPIAPFAEDIAASVGVSPEEQFSLAHAGIDRQTLNRLAAGSENQRSRTRRSRSRDDALARSRNGIFQHFLMDLVITKLDRATMAYGVEARSPFLDEELVAWGLALTPEECCTARAGKTPVRGLVRELVGETESVRQKRGFRAPLARVLRGPLRSVVEQTLAPDRVRESHRWDAATVETLIHDHMSEERDRTQILWTLLVYETWWHRQAHSTKERRSS